MEECSRFTSNASSGGQFLMCTYCGQHCVEDELYRLSSEEIRTGERIPENTCPDKQDWEDIMDSLEDEAYE